MRVVTSEGPAAVAVACVAELLELLVCRRQARTGPDAGGADSDGQKLDRIDCTRCHRHGHAGTNADSDLWLLKSLFMISARGCR